MGLTIVDNERQIQLHGQANLTAKRLGLNSVRRVIAKEVEARFADGHNLGLRGEGPKGLFSRIIVPVSVVGMDADAGVDLRVTARRLHCLLARLKVIPDREHQADPCSLGSSQRFGSVGIKLPHVDMGVRIDKH
jgi:hypothetical protein